MTATPAAGPKPGPAVESAAAGRSFLPGRAPWLVILALALITRLAFVAILPPTIPWSDGRGYVEMGRTLLEQHTYGTQTLRGPGYVTFIAAVFAIFGPNLIALRVVESVLGAVSVGLIGAFGARLFGRPAGLIAAFIGALHPVLAFLPSTQFSENLVVLVTTAALGVALEALRREGLWRWALCGVLLGVVLLIRPSSVFLVPGLGLGLALARAHERRGWLKPALVCGATIALTVAPWIVRNHRVQGHWYFIATGGGRQIWFGNNPNATADTRVPSALDPAMQEEIRPLPDDLARERHLYRRALEWMRRNPARARWLYVLELRNMFAFYPETESRHHVNPLSRIAGGLASATVFAGALLALRRFRADPTLWVIVALTASYALGCAFFFTVMRYRMAIEPALLWMAGSGWAALLPALSRRSGSGSA